MRIRYIGTAGVRTIGDAVWSADNDYVAEVPAELAANCLYYPRPQFELAADEPLLLVDGIEPYVPMLAIAGVGSLYELSVADEQVMAEIEAETGLDGDAIAAWVKQAGVLVGLADKECQDEEEPSSLEEDQDQESD